MFGALRRVFRKPSRSQAVSVYYVGSDVYVATEYGADGSDPCYVVGPVKKLSISADASAVGKAVYEGLAACRYDFPAPQSREAWKSVDFPLLEAAGAKSWAALAKRSSSLTVRCQKTRVTVLPCCRDKQSFSPVPEREVTLEAPSDAQLGDVVVIELKHARSNEGPA